MWGQCARMTVCFWLGGGHRPRCRRTLERITAVSVDCRRAREASRVRRASVPGVQRSGVPCVGLYDKTCCRDSIRIRVLLGPDHRFGGSLGPRCVARHGWTEPQLQAAMTLQYVMLCEPSVRRRMSAFLLRRLTEFQVVSGEDGPAVLLGLGRGWRS